MKANRKLSKTKGPFIFYEVQVGGAGGIWGEGECQKNGFKAGGGSPKNMVCKGGGGGSPKKFPLSLVVTASGNNANISARMPTSSISKVLQ